MNFKDLQDATIADSFDESDRDQVKHWINHRYGLLMNQYEWTFTQGEAVVTVTNGSQNVTGGPADLGIVLGLQRADGGHLRGYSEYRKFAHRYLGTGNTQPGQPEAFTVWAGNVLVGPTSNETSGAYLLTYEKSVTPLDDDDDVPVIPLEHHLALVFGAKADGLTLKSVILADPFTQMYNAEIQAMTRKYLTAVRGAAEQVPAYRPGYC